MAEQKPLRVQYQKLSPRCLYCESKVTIVRVTLAPSGELYMATLCEECAKGEMTAEVRRHGLTHLGQGTFAAAEFVWNVVEHLFRAHLEPATLVSNDLN
jgi:superfamily II helicase